MDTTVKWMEEGGGKGGGKREREREGDSGWQERKRGESSTLIETMQVVPYSDSSRLVPMNGIFESGLWGFTTVLLPPSSLSSSAGVIRMDPCVSLPLNESLVSIGNEIEVGRGRRKEGSSSHLIYS